MSEAPDIDLDREAIKQGLREGSFVLVDVREPHEFAAGHIPGAVSHPARPSIPPPAPGQADRLFLRGRRPVRKGLEFAQGAGLDIREHYKGGFKDWAAAGGTGRIGLIPRGLHIDLF